MRVCIKRTMSYYLHLWKNSCLEVVFHFFAMVNTPRNALNYNFFMKIGLYQMGHHNLQVCQVSRNYLSYFRSYGHFSVIFCIYVTFSVPYLHIKTLRWICPESSRIADLKIQYLGNYLTNFDQINCINFVFHSAFTCKHNN